MPNFVKLFLKICHPETAEIVHNAWAALQSGEITRDQWRDVVNGCIREETEALDSGAVSGIIAL